MWERNLFGVPEFGQNLLLKAKIDWNKWTRHSPIPSVIDLVCALITNLSFFESSFYAVTHSALFYYINTQHNTLVPFKTLQSQNYPLKHLIPFEHFQVLQNASNLSVFPCVLITPSFTRTQGLLWCHQPS